MNAHPNVKVILLCPVNGAHVLGAVARQLVTVPGVPAGRESVTDVSGLQVRTSPERSHVKLIGHCQKCQGEPQWSWRRVRRVLDAAEHAETGIIRVPMTMH